MNFDLNRAQTPTLHSVSEINFRIFVHRRRVWLRIGICICLFTTNKGDEETDLFIATSSIPVLLS